jgi:hypothetical protein
MAATDFLMANELLIRVAEDLAAHYPGVRIAAPRFLEVKAAGAPQTIVLRLLSQCDTYAPVAVRLLTSELPATFRSWTGAMPAELQSELIWEGMVDGNWVATLNSRETSRWRCIKPRDSPRVRSLTCGMMVHPAELEPGTNHCQARCAGCLSSRPARPGAA